MESLRLKVERLAGEKVGVSYSLLRHQVEFRKYGKTITITMETLRRLSDDVLQTVLRGLLESLEHAKDGLLKEILEAANGLQTAVNDELRRRG